MVFNEGAHCGTCFPQGAPLKQLIIIIGMIVIMNSSSTVSVITDGIIISIITASIIWLAN